MSARRILAALAGTAVIVLIVGLGASPAGAVGDVPVVDRQSVPTAAGMMPAQLPEPADESGAALANVLFVAGLGLLVGGVAVVLHALRGRVPMPGRTHAHAVGYAGSGVRQGQLLAS